MVQNLLPSKERLFRIKKVAAPHCEFCPQLKVENFDHFFSCEKYMNIMDPVQKCLQNHVQNFSVSKMFTLSFICEESMELPITWLFLNSMMMIWNARKAKKDLKLSAFKAELHGQASLLKETKWKHYQLHNSAILLEEMIRESFN